jgi:hypothetical protein
MVLKIKKYYLFILIYFQLKNNLHRITSHIFSVCLILWWVSHVFIWAPPLFRCCSCSKRTPNLMCGTFYIFFFFPFLSSLLVLTLQKIKVANHFVFSSHLVHVIYYCLFYLRWFMKLIFFFKFTPFNFLFSNLILILLINICFI